MRIMFTADALVYSQKPVEIIDLLVGVIVHAQGPYEPSGPIKERFYFVTIGDLSNALRAKDERLHAWFSTTDYSRLYQAGATSAVLIPILASACDEIPEVMH